MGGTVMHVTSEERLQAYHDGELTALARWRFERQLRRSPALQRELAALRALRADLRTLDATASSPDLWSGIEGRLPEVRRSNADAGTGAAHGRRWTWWLTPLGAAAAATAVAVAFFYGAFGSPAPVSGSVVRWIDSGGRSVMVLDDDPDTTIIWVLDSGATEGAARGGPRDVV
jgi:anti-sigma factor RsiW